MPTKPEYDEDTPETTADDERRESEQFERDVRRAARSGGPYGSTHAERLRELAETGHSSRRQGPAPVTMIFEAMGLRGQGPEVGSDQAKFDTDPEWLSARQVLEAELPGYAVQSQQEQRKILAGMMSDYTTACLSRRTPKSIEAYVSLQAYYRSQLVEAMSGESPVTGVFTHPSSE